MNTLHMKCVVGITGFCLIIVSAATQDVSVVRIEPDPLQQLPCPQQMIEFRCQILVSSFAVQWTLPTGETMDFGQTENIGAVVISSDNAYSATLTDRTGDPNSNNRFFFTSILLVLAPVNGSNLTCVGVSGADPVKESTSIILSGTPDPPKNLGYNDRVVIESSVDLQWTRPTYTGGVAVVNYTVSSTSGVTVTVEDSNQDVKYSPGLIYGEVQVSAINTCGLESQPTVINIPAAASPRPNIVVQFTCESLPWTIEWMYEMEEGVVYPNMDFILSLTPTDETASSHMFSSGDPACSDVTSYSTYCNVTVPRDVYIVSVNLTNEIGSTMNSNQFDTRAVTVTNEILEDGEPLSLTVTVNTACTVSCPVTVSFGTQPVNYGSCEFQQNVTSEQSLSPGDTTTLSVEAGSVTIESGETYCYLVTPCGNPVGKGSGGGVSTVPVAGIVRVIAATLVILIIIVMVCCLLCYLLRCWAHRHYKQALKKGIPHHQCMPKKNEGKEEEVEAGREGPTDKELYSLYSIPDKTKFQTGEGTVAIKHQEGPSGNLYVMPQKPKKNKGKEEEEEAEQEEQTEEENSAPDQKKFQTAGEDTVAIEHQEGPSGDLYAMPQKSKKNKGKEEEVETGQKEPTEEEEAALYSVPDKKREKRSGGLNYADLVITSSSNPAPPLSDGSTYAVINQKND